MTCAQGVKGYFCVSYGTTKNTSLLIKVLFIELTSGKVDPCKDGGYQAGDIPLKPRATTYISGDSLRDAAGL
jgi:hypothetical protein